MWVEAMDPRGTASPRNESQRQCRPLPEALSTHLGLGVNTEAQQAVIDLEGDRVAPGCQVLLSQQCGQAREDLRQGSSRSISNIPKRPFLSLQQLQAEHQHHSTAQPRSQLWEELAQLAAAWLLTHRRAEVELLQACEDMIPMKVFEASENFFISTGLGTLPG